jgi:predicted nucleic acid-binding protein
VTRYTIDAPTLLHIVTEQLAFNPEHQLVAPQAIRSQALSLLLGQVRRGELTEKDARALHTRLTELKIRVLGDRVSRWTSFQIANEQRWETTYDAEYVAVTKLQADALVTVDPEMAKKAEGLVPLAPVSALSDEDLGGMP